VEARTEQARHDKHGCQESPSGETSAKDPDRDEREQVIQPDHRVSQSGEKTLKARLRKTPSHHVMRFGRRTDQECRSDDDE